MRTGGGSLNGFKFGTFIGRFPSDGAARMAVKGLNVSTSLSLAGNSGRLTREGTAAAKAALLIPISVCSISVCPNNGMAASVRIYLRAHRC